MQVLNNEMALITCSYAPDFQRCHRLCQSIDRWVPGDIAHRVIVPARDLPLFRPLENARRSVLAVEDVVPGPFWQLPRTNKWWVDQHGWPVRGWIMQQVTKLSANHASCAEHLIFADSDLVFVRPFKREDVLNGDKLRLHRIPGAMSEGEHLKWHHQAADLLGLERQYFGSDYIGQLITWRRSQLEGLQAHLEYTQNRPWYRGIARSLRVSEYILYGAYIDGVVGLENSGHEGISHDLCHCCWFREEADALANKKTTLREDAVALLLQSNLGLTDEDENNLIDRIVPAPARILEAV